MGDDADAATPQIPLLTVPNWAMVYGDRLALEATLAQVRPKLAIEIGSAQGGSLGRIAAHSEDVHAIDIVRDDLLELPPNATFHEGSSQELLPDLLERFAAQDRNVDFVLVDGDHSTEAVRADLNALLDSSALRRTTILMHDSFHPLVRAGIEAAEATAREKVVACELDLVAGGVCQAGIFEGQPWGGFAMVLVDEELAGGRFDEIEVWVDGPRRMPATMDAWETVVRAEPMVARIAAGGSVIARVRNRLRERLRPLPKH